MSREAMKQALEALESDPLSHAGLVNRKQAIAALRQALEEKQEPVAFINVEKQKLEWAKLTSWHTPTIVNLPKIPLYTSPPKREWVGLTDEEVSYCRYAATFCDELDTAYMAELIEKDLKEKNHG
jgi:hypothetical protein